MYPDWLAFSQLLSAATQARANASLTLIVLPSSRKRSVSYNEQ